MIPSVRLDVMPNYVCSEIELFDTKLKTPLVVQNITTVINYKLFNN
jgi:hypothetical protein